MIVNYLRVRNPDFARKMGFYKENKFGSYLKSRTFALPFEKRVADEADSSYKDWRLFLAENKKLKIFSKKFGS